MTDRVEEIHSPVWIWFSCWGHYLPTLALEQREVTG